MNGCQLLNLSTQLDNTNLGRPIIKQCLILFSLWFKEKNTSAKHGQVKVSE